MKVRPNGVPKGGISCNVRQIGPRSRDRRRRGDFGVAVRVEVHGSVTSELSNFAKIMEYANHPNVYTCWNSNPSDVKAGSIKENFALVDPRFTRCISADLTDEAYPWATLCTPEGAEPEGFTLAEIPESSDPERVLRYFRKLAADQPRVSRP